SDKKTAAICRGLLGAMKVIGRLGTGYITPAIPVSIGDETYSRGSVILPVSALAATVSGEARYTAAFLLPIRSGKLRLVVLMQVSVLWRRPNVSAGPPRQALQPLGPTRQPE